MLGKTVLVTGANQGIGRATALSLARLGAKVVLLCRNKTKGSAALQEVQAAATGEPPELLVADLGSLSDVRRAAEHFRERHSRLDVLVNNAGLYVPSFQTTADGFEETFAVNHLGPFVLTRELEELLKATATLAGGARIVNVSSAAHARGRIAWDDLELRKSYGAFRAYAQSKLANILFTYELARRLEGTHVTANCLHPGVIASGFGQTYTGTFSLLIRIARPFFSSTEEGAKTSVYLASSPEVEGVTGRYFVKCKATRSNRGSYDEASWVRLWEVSEAMASKQRAAA
jgi:NAD(P)-dependent dehydrogenase (short-subunit alcohol dehydrogenase family)